MKIELQVSSPEPSKRLKGLGVKQESYFYWFTEHPSSPHEVKHLKADFTPDSHGATNVDCFSAYTVAELGEMLPLDCCTEKTIRHTVAGAKGQWVCRKEGIDGYEHGEYADTEADARTLMLIYLIENELITL